MVTAETEGITGVNKNRCFQTFRSSYSGRRGHRSHILDAHSCKNNRRGFNILNSFYLQLK
uniref:Uncharacterized protein n=1 Tax=Anguilla anguilla TaxID=7936 RepID=A0A0E9VFT6_ANGAN